MLSFTMVPNISRTVIADACKSTGLPSLLEDNSADIPGMEQPTMGIGFVDVENKVAREDFL